MSIFKDELNKTHPQINCIAFPDAGSAKRFGCHFEEFETVICDKKRDGDKRHVEIIDGDAKDKHIAIVDDLVRTGGTLYQCGVKLLAAGAKSVIVFVAHAAFANDDYKLFLRGGKYAIFDVFYVTDSCPPVVDRLPKDNVFQVLSMVEQIVEDLQE